MEELGLHPLVHVKWNDNDDGDDNDDYDKKKGYTIPACRSLAPTMAFSRSIELELSY